MPHRISPKDLNITRPILNFHPRRIFQLRVRKRARRETGAQLRSGVEWVDTDAMLRINDQCGSLWNTNREANGKFGAKTVSVRQGVRISAGLILLDVALRQSQTVSIDPANGCDSLAQFIIVLRFEKFEYRLLFIAA